MTTIHPHINIYTLDHARSFTNYGRHARVIAGRDTQTGELYARVDLVHGLRAPTIPEILRVAKQDTDTQGKWELATVETESPTRGGHDAIHYTFKRP